METARTLLLKPTAEDYEDFFSLQKNEQSRQYLGGAVREGDLPQKFIVTAFELKLCTLVQDFS